MERGDGALDGRISTDTKRTEKSTLVDSLTYAYL